MILFQNNNNNNSKMLQHTPIETKYKINWLQNGK